ncbi:unnamed protein product [Rotaria sordida]|uniref:C2H2-type domain-containing protein n=1 Tax=Rotaria sordida TaxID=392033 RepID=A0A814KTL5_9BILA|nr:unnamed protein product [Rotaria sordida]CAF1219205.1 unnamed protein product [Rotaria sordida]
MLHVSSMLTYGFLSFILAFFNKALFELANFHNTLVVIFSQLSFILILFHILAYFHCITLPIMTKTEAYTLLIPSIFYCLTTVLSLEALLKLNVAVYVVIKRCTPALTFVLSAIVLKKQNLNMKTGLCVFTITIGAAITSIDDVSYHMESYIIGSFSVLFHSLYLLTIQRYSEQRTSNDILYINSLLSLPMIFMLMIIFPNELSNIKSYEGYNTINFWLFFLLSTFGGGLLNGATFWCTIKNSALTTTVVGVLKSVLQIFFGVFAFEQLPINNKTIIGILLSLIGGTMFSYFEYTNKQTKSGLNVIMMKLYILFIFIWSFLNPSSAILSKPCSRENSRIVRDYFKQTVSSIYEKNHLSIPDECIFSPKRDIFYHQELHKTKITNNKWLCQYCNKVFYSEYYLDIHMSNRHNDTLIHDEQSVCLADYCSIFRCDVLKRHKKSFRAFHFFIRTSDVTKRKSKKILNEQQLTILRSRCASIINECVPHNIKHDTRVKMQHEMYAEICAYLTTNRYFESPTHDKTLIKITSIFCFVICIAMCFIGIAIIKRSDWKFGFHGDDETEKHLSDETISTATALLSKTPRNSIIHSSKHLTSNVRHRVHFETVDEYNHLHSEHM